MKDVLPIGTYVQFHERVYVVKIGAGFSEKKRTIRSARQFGEGFIVGGSFLKEGICSWDNDYGGAFKSTKSVFVYKVVPGYINRPIFVLPEQIAYSHQGEPKNISFCHIPWSEAQRNELSEYMTVEMKDWPRDSKGRWVKDSK
jgi:hypothetical protein